MLILPLNDPLSGLINNSYLTGKTFASSTHVNSLRKDNPILHNSTDRWCSSKTNEYDQEYWGINFDKYIYLTNITLQNSYNLILLSFIIEGKLNSGEWKLISDVSDFGMLENESGTLNISDPGPFSSIKITSRKNSKDPVGYYFCIYKVDFFGAVFSMPRHSCLLKNIKKSRFNNAFLST